MDYRQLFNGVVDELSTKYELIFHESQRKIVALSMNNKGPIIVVSMEY